MKRHKAIPAGVPDSGILHQVPDNNVGAHELKRGGLCWCEPYAQATDNPNLWVVVHRPKKLSN